MERGGDAEARQDPSAVEFAGDADIRILQTGRRRRQEYIRPAI